MARATPQTTPNPNAMKFELDTSLPGMSNVLDPADASTPFERAAFAVDGVVAVFGVNTFVTVTKRPDAEWDAIVPAVVAAAEEHL